MKAEYNIKLCLSYKEAYALKKALGGFNDIQFKENCGIEGSERSMLSEIWDLLPHEDE